METTTTRSRKVTPVLTKMMNVELRFFALLAFSIITVYIVYDTQRENSMSYEIARLTRFVKVSTRLVQKQTRLSTGSDEGGVVDGGMVIEGSFKKMINTNDNKKAPKQSPKATTAATRGDYNEEKMKWLDRSDSKPYRNYGDDTCGVNTDRLGFQWLIRKWTEIAKEHKIRYFLDYGSLLGAWRDEETIPYDADSDIRVHNDDLETLFNLPIRVKNMTWNSYDDYKVHLYFTKDWRKPYHMRRRFSCSGKEVEEYEGQCSFTDPSARLIYRNWHMDLFTYTEYYDTVQFIPDARPAFVKSVIYPIRRCDFMKVETRCPNRARLVLEEHYNNLMPTKLCHNKAWYAPDDLARLLKMTTTAPAKV